MLRDYIDKIEFEEQDSDEYRGYLTTTLYFVAPVEILDKKYEDADATEISIEFEASDLDTFSPKKAHVMISPAWKYDDGLLGYDWHDYNISYEEVGLLLRIYDESRTKVSIKKYCVTVARTGCLFIEANTESEAMDIANHQMTDTVSWSDDWKATDATEDDSGILYINEKALDMVENKMNKTKTENFLHVSQIRSKIHRVEAKISAAIIKLKIALMK